jgi:RHS repeat-associated protein
MLLLPAFGPNGLIHFSPAAATTMAPGLGDQQYYGFWSHQLTDRMTLKVNVANGNLVLETSDLKIAGTGLDLDLGRTYNSLSGNSTDFGTSWTLNSGGDVHLAIQTNGDADFQGPSGYVETFAKNTNGSFTSPAGINATLVENAGGDYTRTFHKNSEQYNFDSTGVFTSDVDQNGNTISFAYDTSGTLASITDTQGRVVTVTSSGGLIGSMTDVASRAVDYTYTGSDLTGYVDANGETTIYSYSSHLLTQITDPNGNETKIAYDSSNRVSLITFVTNLSTGSGPTTSFAYGALLTTLTNANNHSVVYNFDSLGRVTSTHYSGVPGTSTSYTTNNDVASVSDGLGNQTTYSYDANNNLTSIVVPVGTAPGDFSTMTTSFTYTDSAHPYYPTSQTDPQGNTLAYTYDANGNLVSTVDDLTTNNTYSYTYNSDGTLDTITDAMGGVTTYGYDSSGNLTSVTPPSPLGQTTIVPDTLSRVASRTDGKGQVTTYTYDDLDRITQILYNNGSTEDYTFDADGNQTQLVDSTGTTTYTYDALNRLKTKTFPNGSHITDNYDGLGNITSETQGINTYTYSYDSKDRISTVTDPGGGQVTYSYNSADWVVQMSYPLSPATMAFDYDHAGRITKVQSSADSFTYSYKDSAGNGTALRQSETDGYATTHYTYDALNRLTGASGAQNYAYTYDGNGNRLSKTGYGGSGSVTYTYNAANEMTAAGSTTYTYDANGNETGNSAGLAITYNAKNQTGLINPPGSAPSASVGFRGDGQGEMVSDGGVALRGDQFGVSQADNFGGTGTAYFERDNQGTVLGEKLPAQGCRFWSQCQYYYTFDGRGNVQSVVGPAGIVGAKYTYDPYGNITSTTGPSWPIGTQPTQSAYKFGGAYGATTINNTGLVKIGERFYDPTIGRWTQADPSSYQTAIGTRPDVSALSNSTLFPSGVKNWKPSAPTCSLSHPQSLNYYTYANDDPINNVDPSGLGITNCMLDILGFGIAVVALFAPATTFWAIVALVGYLTAAQALMECIEKETPRYWGGNQ